LIAHLLELRTRLLWCVGIVLIIFMGLAFFANELFEYLSKPLMHYLPAGTGMLATEVISPFTAPFQTGICCRYFSQCASVAVSRVGLYRAGACISANGVLRCRCWYPVSVCFMQVLRLLIIWYFR
jgi:Sec-independent protein secretion pathway component TatC